jgi:membrane protein
VGSVDGVVRWQSLVGDIIGAGDVALTVWDIARWPLILALMILAVATLYYATPNVQQPKFRWISVGAGVAMVIASVLFGLYVANFGSYKQDLRSTGGRDRVLTLAVDHQPRAAFRR